MHWKTMSVLWGGSQKGDRLPENLGKSAQYRFILYYGKRAYFVANGDLLQFKDSKNGHTKSVCLKEKIDEILSEIYKNPLTMGTSRDNFFGRIYNMYHGISRKQVQAFLDCQLSYQVYCCVCKGRVVKPIVVKRVNAH